MAMCFRSKNKANIPIAKCMLNRWISRRIKSDGYEVLRDFSSPCMPQKYSIRYLAELKNPLVCKRIFVDTAITIKKNANARSWQN